MKVGNVQERADALPGTSMLDTDELDRSGIDLGATGRLQLMYKLAEGKHPSKITPPRCFLLAKEWNF